MNPYTILKQTERQRASDGQSVLLLDGYDRAYRLLLLVLPQLGDLDSLVSTKTTAGLANVQKLRPDFFCLRPVCIP